MKDILVVMTVAFVVLIVLLIGYIVKHNCKQKK